MQTQTAQLPLPQPLGLRKSFGFGDRLGLAGRGHLASLQGSAFVPILAQQSIRELTRTQRTAEEVMTAAQKAITEAHYTDDWGADADHLQAPEDVAPMVKAGYTFFTIDPSRHVRADVGEMSVETIAERTAAQNQSGLYGGPSVSNLYLGQAFELEEGQSLTFDQPSLLQAAVKYGDAIAHCETMHRAIAGACGERAYELEVSVDETATPTSPLEHLFIALELRRRNVPVVSLAPRFVGDFEKGIDFKGDAVVFEEALKTHMAIARTYGPYKMSVHSGSDKFTVYPILGRICGELLHVKTAGTSYLEALRVVCRKAPLLFEEIIRFALERFEADRATYHVSVTATDLARLATLSAPEREEAFLNQDAGRQVLHVTFGSVLTKGQTVNGQRFKSGIIECLQENPDLHAEVLVSHLGKHIRLLEAG